MTTLLQNFIGGSLSADLAIAGTTMTSPALAAVVEIVAPDTMVAVLDPDGIAGSPEVVLITDHVLGSNTATIVRAQEDTTDRAHLAGTNWVHSLTVGLFESLSATGSSGAGIIAQEEPPTDPAAYEVWLDTDEPAPVTDAAQVLPSLLARTSYNPATLTGPSTASTTPADLDATNLAITFTAPASGSVNVILEALPVVTAATSLAWNLRSGSSDIPGTTRRAGGANTQQVRVRMSILVTGLTPGASYTYKWGQARQSGTGSANTYYGGTGVDEVGPAVMEVHDAATSQGTIIQLNADSVEYPLDAAPATPNVMDDEFSTAGLNAKWTALPNASIVGSDVNTTIPNHLYVDINTGAQIGGWYQPLPATPCKFRMKVTDFNAPGNYSRNAVMILLPANPVATSPVVLHGVIHDAAATPTQFPYKIQAVSHSALATFAAQVATTPVLGQPVWLEIECHSPTSVTFRYSFGGALMKTLSATYTVPFTVANIGIGFSGEGVAAQAAIDWFRRVA